MCLRTKGHYPFSLKFNRGESFHNPPAHVLLHGLSSFFLSRQDLKCQVWKKTSIIGRGGKTQNTCLRDIARFLVPEDSSHKRFRASDNFDVYVVLGLNKRRAPATGIFFLTSVTIFWEYLYVLVRVPFFLLQPHLIWGR